MRKCTKSWESVTKAEKNAKYDKVWESVLKAEKVWGSVQKDEKVQESAKKSDTYYLNGPLAWDS